MRFLQFLTAPLSSLPPFSRVRARGFFLLRLRALVSSLLLSRPGLIPGACPSSQRTFVHRVLLPTPPPTEKLWSPNLGADTWMRDPEGTSVTNLTDRQSEYVPAALSRTNMFAPRLPRTPRQRHASHLTPQRTCLASARM